MLDPPPLSMVPEENFRRHSLRVVGTTGEVVVWKGGEAGDGVQKKGVYPAG